MAFIPRLLLFMLAPLVSFAGIPEFATPILERAGHAYAGEAAALGLPLEIEILKGSPLVVASADRNTRAVRVVIHEGLLRSPRLTADGFRMIVCHELGHIFGGDPRRPNPPEFEGPYAPDGLSLLSAEGQADFFASKCFRRLVAGDSHSLSVAASERARGRCERKWGVRTKDSFVCRRTIQGALEFLNLVMEFPISLEREDLSVAPRTLLGEYPSRQCRLDTMVAAALDGERPACWFKK